MKDSTLLRISLATSIIGLALLFIIAGKIDFDDREVLQESDAEDYVVVRGLVKGISSSDKFTSIDLLKISEMRIIAFANINLSEEEMIEAEGQLKDTDSGLELIAEEIRVINRTSYLRS